MNLQKIAQTEWSVLSVNFLLLNVAESTEETQTNLKETEKKSKEKKVR